MMKGLFVLDSSSYTAIYGPQEREQIGDMVDIYAAPQTAETVQQNPQVLEQTEAIFSGWGCPVLTEDLLRQAPNLKVVFYGAGSIKFFVTDAFWERNIQVTSAYAANAVPVVEYCLGHILLGLKTTWQQALLCRQKCTFERLPVAGAYGSTVGLVSLGMIGRMLVERLKTFEIRILAYDPYLDAYPDVTLCSLDEIFKQSDVVSVHTPWLKETEGLITGAHLETMKPYSTFINSSRGAIVRETEMIAVLRQRADLTAVLDVTYPEPPLADSALYTLPNVILTPHIAGSVGRECQRMGQYMVEELRRYLAGQPLKYALTREQVRIMA
jgi:phosphoglycerate dehydrogenase-like enzyme